MRIGIDISQVVYKGTGVARYVTELVLALTRLDKGNTYVLVGSSLRQRDTLRSFVGEVRKVNPSVASVILPLPPTILHLLWNILHICSVEWFTGTLDLFWSSDWTTPPLVHARGITTIHDLIVYRFPDQFDRTIVAVQKKRLERAAREYCLFFCDSEATAKDAQQYLSIGRNKLRVIYPGN